ncbi:fibroin heavy chain [Poeciliopsis prolifica]|uniref:fibroin heavy chain n=1 Tax=Poeciliopsis prolifica TaxID=188132 RepID=UPI0024138B54|nr:fibroin heavy chain [Poeciliopsis prolifica]
MKYSYYHEWRRRSVCASREAHDVIPACRHQDFSVNNILTPGSDAEVLRVPVQWKLPRTARVPCRRSEPPADQLLSVYLPSDRQCASAHLPGSQCVTCSSSEIFQKAEPPVVSPADADRRMFRAGSIMLLRALLQTSLVLWLAQQTLQGGVSPQNVAFGRALPVRGVGIGVKPGVTEALGAVGNRYGTKAMKTGIGRYPAAHLGVGGYRSLGLGGRGGLKPGGYGSPAGYGASLGTGMGLGTGLTNGLGLGQAGKRVYGAGLGQLPGYGAFPGLGYQGVRPGYIGGAGNYLGAAGYRGGLGQGAYLGGAAGKLSAAAALGQGAYPQGVAGKSNGYGDGVTGYLGAMAGNGFGYGNGYGDGYGAGLGYPADLADGAESKSGKIEALSTGGYAGPVQGGYGGLGTGLESVGGKYGGAAQVPYGNAPVIPAGLEGDGGYPYAAQQLGLAAESAKTASKYGAGAGFGTQQTGFGAALGASQDALVDQTGKYDGLSAGLGNSYKG